MTENDQTIRSLISKYICTAQRAYNGSNSVVIVVAKVVVSRSGGRVEVAAATAAATAVKAETSPPTTTKTFFLWVCVCRSVSVYVPKYNYLIHRPLTQRVIVCMYKYSIFPYKVRGRSMTELNWTPIACECGMEARDDSTTPFGSVLFFSVHMMMPLRTNTFFVFISFARFIILLCNNTLELQTVVYPVFGARVCVLQTPFLCPILFHHHAHTHTARRMCEWHARATVGVCVCARAVECDFILFSVDGKYLLLWLVALRMYIHRVHSTVCQMNFYPFRST